MEIQHQFAPAEPPSPDESGGRRGGQGTCESADGQKHKLTAFIQTSVWIRADIRAANVNVWSWCGDLLFDLWYEIMNELSDALQKLFAY